MKRALVLLTRNEIEALPKVWDRLPKTDPIIAVDGGSTDGTQEFFKERGVMVLLQQRRGRGDAVLLALESIDADALCFFSPDGNEDPADIGRLFSCVESGADLAIASRMMPGAANEEDGDILPMRKWANLTFTALANALWGRGRRVTDSINGFRAVRRSSLRALRLTARDFAIEYQTTIRALKAGLRIDEIPTSGGRRLGGASTAYSWPTGLAHLAVLLREL